MVVSLFQGLGIRALKMTTEGAAGGPAVKSSVKTSIPIVGLQVPAPTPDSRFLRHTLGYCRRWFLE